MAKGSAETADRVSALIAEIEAEAYARGQADARKQVLDILGAAEGRAAPAPATRGNRPAKAAPKRRAGGGKRAPRGSVPRFVERVLSEHPGSTATEIPGHAAGDTERSIKLASIRNELHNGRQQGRYDSIAGRWSLAARAGGDSISGAPAEPDREDAAGASGGGPTPPGAAPSEPTPGRDENTGKLGPVC